MISKYRDKKGAAGAMGINESDLPSKAKGFVGRKLTTRDQAVARTDNGNIKIRKADKVSASFAMRARRVKDNG